MWIFKNKEGILGIQKSRFKEKLDTKTFTLLEEIDYNEIFFIVVNHCSIRVFIGIMS